MTNQMGNVGMVNQALGFWGLGQVGVAIKGPTGVLYVDSYLTDSDGEGGRLERGFPPPVRPEVTNVSNTDYREAAHLAEKLDFGLVVPTHFDLFAFNAVDPGYFASYLHRPNHEERHKLLSPGELHYFVRESA